MEISVKWNLPQMDEWQKRVLVSKGNIILMCGRQIGKSEIIAKKLADYLLNNSKKHILIVSGVERQASGLFEKTLRYIEASYPDKLCIGKKKPLKTIFHLKNGSILRTEPIGLDGSGARQHTLDGVVCEEMQLIPEEAFSAITPMLLTTSGFMWLLGTAWASEGYVWERLRDPDFQVFRINSEEVAELRPEPQRTMMKEFLVKEKIRLGESRYNQEYLAVPSEKLSRFFPENLIKELCVLEREPIISKNSTYYLGVDVGRIIDPSTFEIVEILNNEAIQRENIIKFEIPITETAKNVIELDEKYNFEKMGIDGGGMGAGVVDILFKEDNVKSRIVDLNNSRRVVSYDESKKTVLLKEDMYRHLLTLMYKRKVKFLRDPEVISSFRSVQIEYKKDSKDPIISGNNTHVVEGLIRALHFYEGKELNIMIYSLKV